MPTGVELDKAITDAVKAHPYAPLLAELPRIGTVNLGQVVGEIGPMLERATDVASLIFKEGLPDSMAARLVGYRPCITFVTLGELAKWVELRSWSQRWIAASCLIYEVALAKLNVKDFADFVDHEGLELISY